MTEEKKIDWDRFPAEVENPSDYRTGKGNYGVTFRVALKHVGYIQPMMKKADKAVAVFVVPAGNLEEAERIIKANDQPQELGKSLPATTAPGPETGRYATVEAVAQALGLDPRTVQLDADRWPAINPERGRYDLLAYCAALRKAWKDAENTDSEGARKEKTLILQEQRIRLQLKNKEHAGQLVNAGKMERAIEAVDADDRNEILNMPKKLSPEMDMISGTEAEVKLNKWARQYLSRGSKYARVLAIAGKAVSEPKQEQNKPEPSRKKKAKKK